MILTFLYHTVPGRKILKVLTKPELSGMVGRFMDSSYSKFLIPYFVKKNHIDLSQFEKKEYQNFNECFCRKIRPELRPIDKNENSFISPCDGLLSAYHIEDGLVIPVKGSHYGMTDLLRDEELAKKYEGGICLVFRLCVNHYHRYCYLDNGMKEDNTFIPGVLHTVRPIALREVPVFTENTREYTVLHTDNFGDVVQMEVGAMLVGKIDNYHGESSFQKGQEKGRFLYGGSTIILLLEKGKVDIPKKAFYATAKGKELSVRMGQKIGCKI